MLIVVIQSGGGSGQEQLLATGEAREGEKCAYCRRVVPHASLALHQAGCGRRNSFCERCETVVEKARWEEHEASEHCFKACELCGEKIEKFLIALHMRQMCRERKVTCEHCGFFCSFKNMAEHTELCQNKSTRCRDCGRLILVKHATSHSCGQGSDFYCPLCISREPIVGEAEFVAHLEKYHSEKAKQVNLACPICILEGSIDAAGPHPPLLAHLDLHKYRIAMRMKRN
jgi:hypothetical protein